MSGKKKRSISPRDLAAAIEVSESSLKRWVDEGRLTVVRTVGGHRRIPVSEAVRFVREHKLRVVDASRLGFDGLGPVSVAGAPPSAEELEELFRSQWGREASQRILRAYLGGASVATLCDDSIRGSLDRVGEAYRHQDDGIAIEHAAVDACLHALHAIRQTLHPPEGAPTAVGGAAPDDPYVLPSLSVSVVLESLDFRAINTGPNTPLAALRSAAETQSACLIWRSYSVELTDPIRRAELDGLSKIAEQSDVEIVLGGRCWEVAEELGPRAYQLSSLTDLAEHVRRRVWPRAAADDRHRADIVPIARQDRVA